MSIKKTSRALRRAASLLAVLALCTACASPLPPPPAECPRLPKAPPSLMQPLPTLYLIEDVISSKKIPSAQP